MTQGVTEIIPTGPASADLPVVLAAASDAERAQLRASLAPEGFEVVACRTLEAALTAAETFPEALLLADGSLLQPTVRTTLLTFQTQYPRLRRVLLMDADGLTALDEAIAAVNEGLVHRLLIRPLAAELVVKALQDQAFQQRQADRAAELKALAAKKSRELDLAQRLLRLQRLAAVGTLAAGIAHEINNPLGSILAFAQILIREGRLPPEDLEALQFIEDGAVRCKRIIDAVVRFARVDDTPDTYAPVRLSTVARETLGLMRKEIEAAGAEARLDIGDETVSVRGAEQPLLQLTQALIANAVEATRDAPRPRHIAIRVFSREDRACLAVADSGHGIAPELQERIFEPFYTTKTEGEAIGLGLTTADRIAQSHGGLIEVASKPEQGATFTLVLPRLNLGHEVGT